MSDLTFAQGFIIGRARAASARARGQVGKVFDWDKAARRIVETDAIEASAGLEGDWPSTSGDIWHNGKPVPSSDTYTYLASAWATPLIEIDGHREECWIAETDTEWDSHTYWPETALAIIADAKGSIS